MSKKSYHVPDGVSAKIEEILVDEGVAQHTALSAQVLAYKYNKLTRRSLKDDMQCEDRDEDWWLLLRSLRSVNSMQIGIRATVNTVLFYIERPFTIEQQKLERLVTRFLTSSTNGTATVASIEEQYRPSPKYESLSQHVAGVFDGISVEDLLLKVIRARVDKSNANLHTYSLFSPSPKKAERSRELSQSRKAIIKPRAFFPQEATEGEEDAMEVNDERNYRCPDNVRAEILRILKDTTRDRPMSAMLVANEYCHRNHTKLKVAMNLASPESKPWHIMLCKLGGGIRAKQIEGRASSTNTYLYLSKPKKELQRDAMKEPMKMLRLPRTEAQSSLIRDVKLLLTSVDFQQQFSTQAVEARYSLLHAHLNGNLADNVRLQFEGMTVEDFLLEIIKVNGNQGDEEYDPNDLPQSSSSSSVLGKRPRLITLNPPSKRAARSDINHTSQELAVEQHPVQPEFSLIPVKQSKVTFAAPDIINNTNYVAPDPDASFSPIDQGEQEPLTNVDNDEMEVDYDESYTEVPTQQQQENALKEQQVITSLSALIKNAKQKPFGKSVGSMFNEFLMENLQYFTDDSLVMLLSYCGDGGQDDPVPTAVKWIKLRFFERCLQEGSIATQAVTIDRLRRLFHIMHRKLCCSFRQDNDLLTPFLRMLKLRLEHHLASSMPPMIDAETLSECFHHLRHAPYTVDYAALVDVLSQCAVLMPAKFNREQLSKVVYGFKAMSVYDKETSIILQRITNMVENITLPSIAEAVDEKEILHQCKYFGKGLQKMLQSAARGSPVGDKEKDREKDRDSSSVTSSSIASSSNASSSVAAGGGNKVITDSNIMKPLLFLLSSWISGIETLLTRSSIPKDEDLVAFLFQSLKEQGLAISLYSEFRRLLVTFVRYSRGRSHTISSKDNVKTLENILAFIASMKHYDSNIVEVRELLAFFTKELNDHHSRMLSSDQIREAAYKRALSHGYGPFQLRRALCSLRSDCVAVRYFVMALRPWLELHGSGSSSTTTTIRYHISSLIGVAGLGAPLRQALTNPAIQVKPILEDYEDQFVNGFLLPTIDQHFSSLSVVNAAFIMSIAPALIVAEDDVFDRIATHLMTVITVNMPSLLQKGEAMLKAIAALFASLLEEQSGVGGGGERVLTESYRSLLALCFSFLKPSSTADSSNGGVMTSTLSFEAFQAVLNITLQCCNHVSLLPTLDAFSLLTGSIQSLISTIRLAAGQEKKTQLAIELLSTVRSSTAAAWLQWYHPVAEMTFLTAFNVFVRHVQAFTASTDELSISQARITFDLLIHSKIVQALIVTGNEQQGKLFVDRLIGSVASTLYPIKLERDLMLFPWLLQWNANAESVSSDHLRSTVSALVKELLDMQYVQFLMNELKTKTISKNSIQQWRDNLSSHIATKTMKASSVNDVNTQRIVILQELIQPGHAESLLSLMLPLLISSCADEADQKLASHVVSLAGILLAIAWTNPPFPLNGSNDPFLQYYQAIRRMRLPVDGMVVAACNSDPDASKVLLPLIKHIIGEIQDSLFTDVIMKRIDTLSGEQYLNHDNLKYLYEGVMSTTFASHRRLRTRSEAKDKLENLLDYVYLRGKGVISYLQSDSGKAIPSWWSTAIEDETVLPYVGNALHCSASSSTASLTAQYAWASFTDHVLVCSLPALFSFDYVAENEGILAVQLARLNIAINSQSTNQKAGFMVSSGLLKIVQHRMIDQDNTMEVEEAKGSENGLARIRLLVDVIPTASTVQQARSFLQQKVLDEDTVLQYQIFDGCIRVQVYVSTNPSMAEEGEDSSWSHLTLIISRTKRMLSLLLQSLELQSS